MEQFLKYLWNEKIKIIQDDEILEKLRKDENFLEFFSVLACYSLENYEKFNKVKIFSDFISLNYKNQDLKQTQAAFFQAIKNNDFIILKILANLEKLKAENIIDNEHFIQTKNFLKSLKKQEEKIEFKAILETENFYKQNQEKLQKIINILADILEQDSQKQRLKQTKEQLLNSSFSIGITGVINAGKSTMLNALMKNELLGTSVVPETANLSIIKYSKTPYAKVNFWNELEWQSIEKQAQSFEAMREFVQNAKSLNLANFITKDGKSEQISLNELSKYTSAKDFHSNLIKSVELYVDLDFVKDGVHIVDTPGLDDPVIQREEITKTYMSKCDLMIHLMNVNQVATQKDVDFIIDTLTYGGVSRLLVVISRIDTVSDEELNEALNYTKKSIKKQLELNGKENSFDSIIKKLDFLPISGYYALMHSTNRADEAIKQGWDYQKTAMPKLEAYLENTLFSKDSQKAELIIQSAVKNLNQICENALSLLKTERENLNKSDDEIKQDFIKKQQQNVTIKEQIKTIQNFIENETINIKDDLSKLKISLKSQIQSAQNRLKQRILDDFSYEARKNKTKPKEQRTKIMLEFGLKDSIVDLARDYKFGFDKNMQKSLEKIQAKSENFKDYSLEEAKFDAKEYFEKNFTISSFESIYQQLVQNVQNNIKNTSIKDISLLENTLSNTFSNAFLSLEEKMLFYLDELDFAMIENFIKIINEPMSVLQAFLNDEEEQMQKQIRLKEGKQEELELRNNEVLSKINKLEQIKENL